MSEKTPRISFIVPVYNKKITYLKRCFDSLVNQTYKNCEIIIVNDGSNYEVTNFCKNYSVSTNCRYYEKRNGGVSSARNVGLEKAKGSYVMFIDSDDWLDIDCCEHFFGSGLSEQWDILAFSYVKEYPKRKESVKTDGILYEMSILGSACMKFYRKEMLKGIEFNENLENAEDVEFNFRVFKNVKKYKYEQCYFYHYRIISESAVRKFDKNAVSAYEKTIKAIEENVNMDDHDQFVAYINFLGIAYLVLLLNYVYAQRANMDRQRMKKDLRSRDFVKVLFKNTKKLSLPLSRKILILLDKYHFGFLVAFALYLKHRRDE